MVEKSWSCILLQGAVFCAVLVTFATGMALTSGTGTNSESEIEPWRPYYIAHACEWTFLSLDCPMNRVINVVRANYGRQNVEYCPHMRALSTIDWQIPCVGIIGKSRRIVSQMCNGHTTCMIPVFNGLFGDPCPNSHKYLEVYYACVDAPSSGSRRLPYQ